MKSNSFAENKRYLKLFEAKTKYGIKQVRKVMDTIATNLEKLGYICQITYEDGPPAYYIKVSETINSDFCYLSQKWKKDEKFLIFSSLNSSRNDDLINFIIGVVKDINGLEYIGVKNSGISVIRHTFKINGKISDVIKNINSHMELALDVKKYNL